jgi:FkbM family methyltransferase
MLEYAKRRIRRLRRSITEGLAAFVVATLGRNKRIRKNMVRNLFAQYLDPSCRVSVEFPDHRFLIDPKDTQIGFKLMSGRPWQRWELEYAIASLKERRRFESAGVFVDIGANIGTQTIYALLTGEFSRGLAIEAEPGNHALLAHNIKLNNLEDRVAIVHCAASNCNGTIRLRINENNGGGHRVAGNGSRRLARVVEVPANTVDAIAREASVRASDVGLVWIDVEGHELVVLEGMHDLLAARAPIVMEYTGDLHGKGGADRLRRLLEGRYESVLVLEEGPSSVAPSTVRLSDFTPGPLVRDLLIY